MRGNRRLALLAVPLLLAAAACAPVDEETDAESAATPTESGGSPGSCAPEALPLQTEGVLTIGTDSPAYEPWFVDNDPSNGEGYESAVAYAVAEEMGFSRNQVTWVKVPFNTSYAPGEKKFDFDINQVSITPAREKAVDFSDGYYSAAQAVIAPKGSDAAEATSVEDLKDVRLGAQTGTTSLTAVRDIVQPNQPPLVFEDTNAAKQALANGQVDAIVADLPTAFIITATEIPNATIVGQFQPVEGETEQFGLLFEQGSELVPCVNRALASLKESGELEALEKKWISDVADVPVLD
jgi:polar amino acid transport system substrate-binding protein